MNKDPYDLTPVQQKDIFTYTDMTEEDFEDIVFNCFLEHAKQSFNYPEPYIDADGIFKFSRDLRAALAAANGPLQATTSKPLSAKPWSGSNLTEMEELLQKVQRLEHENAALWDDKERLDWMDEYDVEVQKYENPEDGSKRYEIWFFVDTDPSPIFSAPTLRAAIDTARGAARKEAKP